MTYLFEFDFSAAMTAGMSTVIFTLLFIDFFDTAGTLTSVANVAGKVDKNGKFTEDLVSSRQNLNFIWYHVGWSVGSGKHFVCFIIPGNGFGFGVKV